MRSTADSGAARTHDDGLEREAGRARPVTSGRSSHVSVSSRHSAAHVLFVDDDESNLVVWEAACTDRFRALTANGAEHALALMREHEVGVILADQRMPRTTGIQLLEQVRTEFPETIRILITAYSDIDASIDAINRGHVRRYLKKPCTLPELRAEISDSLDLYELRQRVRTAEKRLLLTERVYALGLVAAGIGRELARPASWIRDSLVASRTELRSVANRLELQSSPELRTLRTKLLEVEQFLERALQGSDRVLDIAHSVELPATNGDTELVEMTEVLRVALKLVRAEIRHGTDVRLDIRAVPKVRCTSAKLSQVALNLLVNAIDAVGERAPEDRFIVVRLFEEDGTVRLEIMDNGPNIEEKDLLALFDPLHAGTSARNTGLGLAISKAIVEEAGGAIDVANRSGGGVLFRVVLPSCEENP